VGGLVVVAGGARIFTNAYVLLHMLRHVLRSSLPVELWYFGQREISPAMAAAVEPLDVRLVDANPLIAASGANVRDGWQLKCFALVHSRFAEVLLLDADRCRSAIRRRASTGRSSPKPAQCSGPT
jgi:Mannosyltransferase putative